MQQIKPEGRFDELIKIDCVADIDTRQRNIDYAVSLGLPLCIQRKRRKGKVAIVGSGPSVSECVDILKEFDGEIWGINRSFEWMRHRGVKPTAFLGIDPEWFLTECLPTTPEDATYYIATQVHPSVFDHLSGKNIRLWAMADSEVRHPATFTPIYGGTTCLTRAPNLAWHLGYREVHIFGGDSSYTHKTHVHGGELPANTVINEVNGVPYKTTKAMMSQACEFIEQMVEWARMDEPLSVSLYGDGLMQSLYGSTLASGAYEQYLAEEMRPHMNRKQRRASRAA
jgi:hypothetical protein